MDKKPKKKNDIISASIDLMYLKGYNGTSVKDITDAAGIPKGSFYNHFQDKEHYAVDALNYYYHEISDGFQSILLDQDLEPLDRIKEFFQSGISRLKQQDLKQGCFLGNLTQEMGNTSKLISDAAAKIHGEIESRIYNNLVEAYDRKVLKSEQDLAALASFVISSWQGTILRIKATDRQNLLDDFYTVLTEKLLQ